MKKEVTMMVKVTVAEGQVAAATHHACAGGLCIMHVTKSRWPAIQQLCACTANLMPALTCIQSLLHPLIVLMRML